MHLVACQFDIAWEDKPANFARVDELLRSARVPRGSLVVLPEMFATGFSMNVERIAEPPGGPTEQFLSYMARGLESHVVGGLASLGSDGRARNVSLVVAPDGEVAARYTKLHPFTVGGEHEHYAAGQDVVTLACGPFTLAPLVCYDLRFPEAFRRAVRRGANLLTVIASWPEPREQHWVALLRARAIENQAFVVGVNRSGADPKLRYPGLSRIFDPQGLPLAEAGRGEEVLDVDVALEPLLDYRRKLPFLADMRNDLLA
jgi:predicted amidohydrolase